MQELLFAKEGHDEDAAAKNGPNLFNREALVGISAVVNFLEECIFLVGVVSCHLELFRTDIAQRYSLFILICEIIRMVNMP
jgi:hypothetical protein